MCENNRFCMRKWLRNVARIILHQFSAPGVAKITYFDVCACFVIFNMFFYICSSKNIYFAHFDAPGMLKKQIRHVFYIIFDMA